MISPLFAGLSLLSHAMCLQKRSVVHFAFESAGVLSDTDEDEPPTDVTESGGTGEGVVFRETPVVVSSPILPSFTAPDPPPLALTGESEDRPLIGSTFSRPSRLAVRRKSQAELWSIAHVNASDKWIAQQVLQRL